MCHLLVWIKTIFRLYHPLSVALALFSGEGPNPVKLNKKTFSGGKCTILEKGIIWAEYRLKIVPKKHCYV